MSETLLTVTDISKAFGGVQALSSVSFTLNKGDVFGIIGPNGSGKTTLANSITLTPGTITMDIRDGEFMIHALNEKVARDLDTGEMEDRVAHVYMEADHMYVQDVLDVAPIFGELRK